MSLTDVLKPHFKRIQPVSPPDCLIIISLTEVLKPQRIQPVSPPDCLASDVSPLAPYWRLSLASNASRPSHHRLPQEYH